MTPLNADLLRAQLSSNQLIGRQLEVLAETTSTNDICQSRAQDAAWEGLVVFAESQRSGRGQRGSTWSAPPGSSLLFSILLFPPEKLAQPHFLTAWSALSIVEALRSAYPLETSIKWPNDLMIGGRKLCGILVEKGYGTVVGIGLNVAIRPEQFPAGLRMPATSLETELGQSVDRNQIAARILTTLDRNYHEARWQGPSGLWDRWCEYSEPISGSLVTALTRREEITGKLLALRPDRGARIARSDGTVANIPPEELVRIGTKARDQSLNAGPGASF